MTFGAVEQKSHVGTDILQGRPARTIKGRGSVGLSSRSSSGYPGTKTHLLCSYVAAWTNMHLPAVTGGMWQENTLPV